MDELFLPPGGRWCRVSPRLASVRRALLTGAATVALLAAGVCLVAGALVPAAFAAVLVVAVVLAGWGWWLVGRSVRRWGYAELPEELYITRGALVRRLVVVPYARMQYVDVHAGPADRLAGIATLRLHTAAPGTSAVVPGLPAEEAARLRDRLTSRSDTSAGL